MKKFFSLTALLVAAVICCGSASACGLEKGSKGTHGTESTEETGK